MTNVVKFKPEYYCLDGYDAKGNRRKYKSKRSDGSCFKCGGKCPYESECMKCNVILPNTEMRFWVNEMDHQFMWAKGTIEKKQRVCASCLDKRNEIRVNETKRGNENAKLNESIVTERYEIRLADNLVRADELYGPDFGHQLLIEYHLRVIIDGKVVEKGHSNNDLKERAREWERKIESWLEICRLLDAIN